VAASQSSEPKTPYVVRIDEIHSSADRPGMRERSFLSDPRLREATASTGVHMRAVSLAAGGDSGLRSHTEASLLIVLKGEATLGGEAEGRVCQGNVVTIPAGREYRLLAGPQGLEALETAFARGEAKEERGEEEYSLKRLLVENEKRLRKLTSSPYFKLLEGNALASNSRRAAFRDYTRVFSDAFQKIILLRQATCANEEFGKIFSEHLREELGHNQMLTPSGEGRVFDAVLHATSSWFVHQMLMLDNAGKAIIHLVLESGGYFFHTAASSVFAGDQAEEYFVTHAEDDDAHRHVVLGLLEGHHPETYKRLTSVLEDAWNMLDAMTQRTVELVEQTRIETVHEPLHSDVREIGALPAVKRRRTA
jgi:mannose-6-phosphate isomerase-like protein (cupin superfamily)